MRDASAGALEEVERLVAQIRARWPRVEILNPSRSRKLFTLYNNHLKSKFVPYNQNQAAGNPTSNVMGWVKVKFRAT